MIPDDAVTYAVTPQGRPLDLLRFRPASDRTGPFAAVVFFFGGGWYGGSMRQFQPQCAWLASRGMVALCADYRVASRDGSTAVDAVADARMALRWVHQHAAELEIDPERIVLGGGSAGGHLALCAVLTDAAPPPVRGFLLFNPVLDTTRMPADLTARLGAPAVDLSPMHLLRAGLPPAICFFGDEDHIVPPPVTADFRQACHGVGMHCEVVTFPGRDHGFFNYQRRPEDYADCLRRSDLFLQSLDLLPARENGPEELLRRSLRFPAREDFDVFLLMGQSNMEGPGEIGDDDRQMRLDLVTLDEDGVWQPAVGGLHGGGLGPGLAFARILAGRRFTGVVPCAVGGTPLERWERGGDLYRRAVERAGRAAERGILCGVCWHQGERDAREVDLATTYGDRLTRMIGHLREDLGTPDLPMVIGEIGRFLEGRECRPGYADVIAGLYHVVTTMPRVALVSTAGLEHRGDRLHFATESVRELGRRYAAAMAGLLADSSGSGGDRPRLRFASTVSMVSPPPPHTLSGSFTLPRSAASTWVPGAFGSGGVGGEGGS